jgi:hypothetical protein
MTVQAAAKLRAMLVGGQVDGVAAAMLKRTRCFAPFN